MPNNGGGAGFFPKLIDSWPIQRKPEAEKRKRSNYTEEARLKNDAGRVYPKLSLCTH